jgi:mannan endo-1,4-beta-mannosidase
VFRWVEQNVGKSPAIIGLDMIDYSPSRVAFQGNVSTTVEDAIKYDGLGTMVAMVWHWNAPTDLINNATEGGYHLLLTRPIF